MSEKGNPDPEDLAREFRTLTRRYDRMRRKLSSMEILQAQNNNIMQALMSDLEAERARSEELLLNILPEPIAQRLKDSPGVIADSYDEVSILFADIVGFSALTRVLSASDMVGWLNEIYSKFDEFVLQHGVEKIRTIGDNYMVAAGVPYARPDHAIVITDLALAMRDYITSIQPDQKHPINFRIGINSGPVVGGIIGKHKFQYDIWGEAVNLASRMESHGAPGRIQVSQSTHQRIKNYFECESRGTIRVKGDIGMECWFVENRA